MHATWLLALAKLPALLYLRLKVRDRGLRSQLTPNYSLGCKRVLLSNDWYPAISSPNVTVVSDAIASVRERSIVDRAGVARPVDAIVFGTGFRVGDSVPPNLIIGRGGRDLAEVWREGPEAYKGTTVAGFPNLFVLVGPNTAIGHTSLVYMIESQIRYVLSALAFMCRQGVRTFEVKREAQTKYNAELQGRSSTTVFKSGGCRSYYLDPKTSKNVAIWPDYSFLFRWTTRRFDPQQYHITELEAVETTFHPKPQPSQPAL
jgi:cyclohexanone monooxygenase